MNVLNSFALLANGEALDWNQIPEYSLSDFIRNLSEELELGARMASFFALPEGSEKRLVAVLALDSSSVLCVSRSQPFSGSFPSLTPKYPEAHLFEREIYEQYGLLPLGHPWLKPVRKNLDVIHNPKNFFSVEGSEIHEVSVGPVHAGVIEPGHFRFQCDGEEVLHLEIALGYQHRGIEEALLGGPHRLSIHQIETIAGDTSIGHATAYAQALEALAGVQAPLYALWVRAIALELERLANHTGDLGALANDVAFIPTSSACGKIRGDFLNLTALLCGNRFGRGMVRPGFSPIDCDPKRLALLSERFVQTLQDALQAVGWLWDSASSRARFEQVGSLNTPMAAKIGLVGLAARSCGLVRDVRFDHPTGWYRFAQVPLAVWPDGDVFSRAKVRWLEMQHSGEFLKEQFNSPPETENADRITRLAPDKLAVSLIEGWRGEICHVALTDSEGRFRRYKVTDPSFHNWMGLALALRNQAISDFPICNKSFNLSYCGFDL